MKHAFIPNTDIKIHETSIIIALEVSIDNPYQTEVVRLEAKYGGVLSKKEVAHELGISLKVLTERIHSGRDLPQYKEISSGRHIFPISAVASFLSKGLIKTVCV